MTEYCSQLIQYTFQYIYLFPKVYFSLHIIGLLIPNSSQLHLPTPFQASLPFPPLLPQPYTIFIAVEEVVLFSRKYQNHLGSLLKIYIRARGGGWTLLLR